MSWLFSHHPLRGETPLQHMTALYNNGNDSRRVEVIDGATVGRVIYLALRVTPKPTGAPYVTCAVVLYSNTQKNGFGYKDMDETVGPSECSCPLRILNKLSPVSEIPGAGYAAEWRDRVRLDRKAKAAKVSLRIGDILHLQEPANFGRYGVAATTFKLVNVRGRSQIFAPVDQPDFLCRLSNSSIQGATVESNT